ncbi:FUSC family membrane protein [Tamlana sp. 2_MG-2023]|uniref:FUSC family protein n=1 Tax=unclassified Tamlana TaxID=2614803 RepID=UPI0026E272D8|nr:MULTISPECIES: FUSC family membrane protein [unclassified Tamlana]MDO6761405.1 FUSC family membrane protein [Tamlana sp. 2_MG-2023]MDO6791981.1 FUSC family membrane protein [Tamlana sp. 1_MG-2023]
MVNNLLRYFKSTHFTKAFLVAFAMAIPVFVSIYFFDRLDIGFSMALGAILCAPSDVPGSLKHKFYGIFASIILTFVITLVVGYFSSNLVVLIPLLIVLVFSVAYISVFGFRASLVSLSGLLSLVLAFAHHSTETTSLEHSVYIALGGTWFLILTTLAQIAFSKVEVDFLYIQLIEKTSEFIRVRGKLLVETTNRPALFEQIFKLQTEINELHETIREVILERRRSSGFSNRSRRRQLFFSKIMEIYELAISNTIDYEKLDTWFKEHPEEINDFKLLLFEISERLNHLSKVILKEEKLSFQNNFKILLNNLDNHIEHYKISVGLPESREGTIFLLNYKTYLEKQISNLNDMVRILNNYSKNDKIGGIKDAEQFITPQDYDFKKLKANFSFKSPIFRHSLRLTVTMLIGFIIGHAIEMQQPYWIILTIVVIMRPSYSLTKERTKNRVAGTLIGATVGVGIVFLTQNTIIYGVIAAVSLIIGFSLVKQNYRNGAAFITLYVIFMYALMTPNILNVIKFRVIDTLIGAVLAYVANYLLWPAWESKNIKEYYTHTIDALSLFLKEVDQLYHKKGEAPTSYSLARKEVFLEIGNMNAAYQRFAQEPKSKQSNAAVIYELTAILNTFLSSLSSLGMYIRTNETGEAPRHFEIYIKHINFNLLKAVAILNNVESGHTLATDEIKQATEKYDNYFHDLAEKRDKEIEAGLPITPGMRRKLHETQLVSEQVKWLLNLSENLVKKVKKI